MGQQGLSGGPACRMSSLHRNSHHLREVLRRWRQGMITCLKGPTRREYCSDGAAMLSVLMITPTDSVQSGVSSMSKQSMHACTTPVTSTCHLKCASTTHQKRSTGIPHTLAEQGIET